jgi:hypothetical protein
MATELRRSWITSKPMARSFSLAAPITVFGIALSLLAGVLGGIVLGDFGTVPVSLFTFIVAFAYITILLATSFYLWAGMLFFMFRVDRRRVLSKCLWLLGFLIGTSLTAALYYFKVYRPLLQGRCLSTR